MDALERANALLDAYAAVAQSELPPGVDLFDAHTHVGLDIDGMTGDVDELLEIQRSYGISRSFVFCLDEPDRHPAFSAANDRTLASAASSGGALLPFVRLDLNESPLEEAERCLELGARGIKLHPRAQGFLPDDPRLEPVFALAAERRVPILIHGGRGLPPIADGLARLVDRHAPTLIIAHAGIIDLAALARNFAGRPGVFFDTSVWSPLDLLDLYRLVSPEQVVYASDYPYGRQPNSLLMAVRTARTSGLDGDMVRAMLGGNAQPDRRRPRPAPADSTARPRRGDASAHVRSHPPVPVDGSVDAVAAPATRHLRRARARAQRVRRTSRTGTGRRRSASGSCSSPPATCGSWPASRPTRRCSGARREARSGCSTWPTSSPSRARERSRDAPPSRVLCLALATAAARGLRRRRHRRRARGRHYGARDVRGGRGAGAPGRRGRHQADRATRSRVSRTRSRSTTNCGSFTVTLDQETAPETAASLVVAGQGRLLRRHGLPPHRARLRHPGRRPDGVGRGWSRVQDRRPTPCGRCVHEGRRGDGKGGGRSARNRGEPVLHRHR